MRMAVVGAVVLLAATAHGGIEHTMLHGVSVGRVRANVGPDSVRGLTQEQLQGMAESRLREFGVPLDPKAEPAFFIGATVVTSLPGACFVHLEARLIEAAKLDRNGQAVDASSWRGGSDVAANSLDQCATLASKAAQEVVADFVEHYRAMNPAALCANIRETPAPAVVSEEGGEMNSVEESRGEDDFLTPSVPTSVRHRPLP